MSKRKRLRDLKSSLNQETARVKMYKSGKSWIKASIKEIKLLGILGMQVFNKQTTEIEDKKEIDGLSSTKKKKAIQTASVLGGSFTVAMLHEHQALAASELPVTSEMGSLSGTVGNQNSVTVSQSEIKHSTSANSETSESETTKSESISSTSEKTSEISENSESSTKEKSSSEKSSLTSEKSSSEKSSSTSEKSSSEKSSSTSEKNSSEKSSSTSEKNNSEKSSLTSEKNSSGKNSTNLNTAEKDLGSSSISMSTSDSGSTAPIKLRSLRSITTNMLAATATASQTNTYTGSGIDTTYNIPIYYKLVATSDGKNITFTYTVTYDNPNTETIETAPANYKDGVSIYNTSTSRAPMIKVGNGLSVPASTGKMGVTDPKGNFITQIPANNSVPISYNNGGYSWSSDVSMNGFYAKKGYGLTTIFTVPVKSSGDTTWTFTPYSGSTNGTTNYFKNTVQGLDPVASVSLSTSLSNSENASTSTSKSTSTSLSNSENASASTSLSTSVSDSDSTSTSLSTSVSGSDSASTSLSTSERPLNQSTDSQMSNGSEASHHAKQNEALPETGQSSDDKSGLIGAALAMLAGLGLVRKSKKNKKTTKINLN